MKLFTKTLLFLISLHLYASGHAQYLTGFKDQQEDFWAFEVGIFTKLEEYPIQNFQVGGTLIAYLDHASNFKVYQFGKILTLMEVAQIEYTTTDYLLGYSLIDTLYVYDNNQITKLSTDCKDYIVTDSLVIWQNNNNQLNVYYNGQVTTLADNIEDFNFKACMAGDNLFAYVNNFTEEFLVFYKGEIYVLDANAEAMIYQAGCDILAYADSADQALKVFYKGKVSELDIYLPKSFQVGNQMMVYLNNLDDLIIFEKDQVKAIATDPAFYEVKDHVVVFEEQGSFKTFCNGQVYILEQYITLPYYIDTNTIAYLEHNKNVKIFQHCERVSTNSVNVTKFELTRDIIIYAEEDVKIFVYFNDQVYQHIPD